MEKRTEPRKPYSGHIFYVTKEGFCEGRLKNYSSHGLFIAASISPPIGEIITVSLPYLDGKANKCKGQIMWCNKTGFGIELFRRKNGSAQMYFKSEIKLNKLNARALMHQ